MIEEGFAVEQFANIDAEHSLIGGLLLDNSGFDRVGTKLRPDHFFIERNRMIYAEIARQIGERKPCDVVTVFEGMRPQVTLMELHSYVQFLPSASQMDRYADIIIERATSRRMMAAGAQITELASDHSKPISQRLDQAQAHLAALTDETPDTDWVSAHDGMLKHTQILEARASGEMVAWPTGLDDLDDYLDGGFRPGTLVIVGARPSMGKTALGMTIGVNMAQSLSVAMLSMEMSHQEVNDRLTAMIGRVSMGSVKRPARGDGLSWDRVLDGVDRAKALRFSVSDQGGLNINQVRAKARALKRKVGLDVLVVDYIGLMTGLNPTDNRNTQLGEISRGLKTLAKELNLCVLCLAQLNRKAEERKDQMPQMSDLRDSGEIEQDADVIVFIKRPIMSNPELGQEWNHYAKAAVAKNRQGRCGVIDLSYIGDQTRFGSWSGPAPKSPSSSRKGIEL